MKKQVYIVILPNGARITVHATKADVLTNGDLLFSTDGFFEARFQIWAGYGLEE